MKVCQRCGRGNVSWTRDEVRLTGGVVANLCAGCLTEFEGFAKSSPNQPEMLVLTARGAYYDDRALAGNPVGQDLRLELVQSMHKLSHKERERNLEFIKPIPEYGQKLHDDAETGSQTIQAGE